jgi:hypothetical protein
VEDYEVWMKLDEIVDMSGRIGGHHMDIDLPAFWPPTGSLVNGDLWGEGAVRDIDMSTLGE